MDLMRRLKWQGIITSPKKIKSNKFGRINNVIFTPPRRFENKGVTYMLKLMVGSFFKHRNKSWFTEDKNYWK